MCKDRGNWNYLNQGKVLRVFRLEHARVLTVFYLRVRRGNTGITKNIYEKRIPKFREI